MRDGYGFCMSLVIGDDTKAKSSRFKVTNSRAIKGPSCFRFRTHTSRAGRRATGLGPLFAARGGGQGVTAAGGGGRLSWGLSYASNRQDPSERFASGQGGQAGG